MENWESVNDVLGQCSLLVWSWKVWSTKQEDSVSKYTVYKTLCSFLAKTTTLMNIIPNRSNC